MDGFFEILMMVIVIWVFSRGARKKQRQSRLPGGDAEGRGDTEERGEEKAVDWDEAIGDVLEGFGLQRPEQRTEQQKPRPEQDAGQEPPPPTRPGAEAQRRAELARQMEAQRAAEAGRVSQRARSSDLAEIAGLAEAAARRRAGSSESPASVRARRAEAATPGAEALGAAPPAATPRSTSRGLKKLEGLSELERAIIYAEILGPPKGLS